jgi:hypothetical protein
MHRPLVHGLFIGRIERDAGRPIARDLEEALSMHWILDPSCASLRPSDQSRRIAFTIGDAIRFSVAGYDDAWDRWIIVPAEGRS